MISTEKYVRLARPSDIPTLLTMAKNFFHISPYRSMRFDKEKGREFLQQTISSPLRENVCLVALVDAEVVGFIVGAAAEPVFSSAKVGMELGWWLEEEYRGSRSALLMFEAYEDWARRVGCSHIQAAYLPGISPELTKFYEKRGYKHVESSFLKTIKI